MALQPMYPGKINSPQTELASAIDDEQTTIPLLDASKLPPAPNLATIGTGEDAETILYTGVEGHTLTGVTRGFQGAAKSWGAGVKVARLFTEYDYDALKENIEDLDASKETPAGAQAKADAALAAAKQYTDQEVGEISQALAAHQAETVTQVFNVKTGYGAKGDGVTNDAPAIQAAINDAAAAGGGIVYIPPGTYLVGSSLSWTADNITIQGSGRDITMIRDHPNLGANRIFYIVGTPENRIQNITFEDLTIQNGLASTDTYTAKKDGIRCEYVDGLTINRCKITEIQGAYGVATKYTKNILVQNCEFYRWTYCGMIVLVECENIKILDNIFDTALAQNTPQNYTFATGGETLGEGEFFVKNLWIERNKFLNNPRWEGIDTHGGENIWIKNNYVENCKLGIMCAASPGYVSAPVLKNVFIEDNIIIQGNGENDQSGIVVKGEVDSNNILHMAEHIHIRGNQIQGFGGLSIDNTGGITVSTAKDVTISDNKIDDYAQSAVMIYITVWGAKVINNDFGNCRGGITPTHTAGITFRSVGIYDILIEGNRITVDDPTKRPKYFIRNSVSNIGAIQIKNNTAQDVETGLYFGHGSLPVEKTAAPTSLTAKFGDIVYKDTGNPGWYVSSPKIGMGSQITSVIVTVNTTAGSNVATIAANGTRGWEDLPPGMNVVIAGAGAGGADLSARILKNDGKNLTLNVAAETTVSGANVTYQTLTLQAV